MGSLFGGSPSIPKPYIPPPPKQADETVSNAANAERIRRLMAYGKSDTMLTPMGAGAPKVQRKTLLGGA